jgi:hypothetical protein
MGDESVRAAVIFGRSIRKITLWVSTFFVLAEIKAPISSWTWSCVLFVLANGRGNRERKQKY